MVPAPDPKNQDVVVNIVLAYDSVIESRHAGRTFRGTAAPFQYKVMRLSAANTAVPVALKRGINEEGSNVSPLVKKLYNMAIILAVCAAVVLGIIVAANALVARVGLEHSLNAWFSFVRRPDIVAMTVLAILATMTVTTYQQRRGK